MSCAGDGGLQSVLELVHLLLDEPCWEEAAMERAKQVWISNHRSLTKSLERSTADRVMEAMLGPDRSALLLLAFVITLFFTLSLCRRSPKTARPLCSISCMQCSLCCKTATLPGNSHANVNINLTCCLLGCRCHTSCGCCRVQWQVQCCSNKDSGNMVCSIPSQ